MKKLGDVGIPVVVPGFAIVLSLTEDFLEVLGFFTQVIVTEEIANDIPVYLAPRGVLHGPRGGKIGSCRMRVLENMDEEAEHRSLITLELGSPLVTFPIFILIASSGPR
eukprot:scaffold375555_cov146-Cyclotella_meneghiniana.AAC.1